eukprot:s3282_g4.t1
MREEAISLPVESWWARGESQHCVSIGSSNLGYVTERDVYRSKDVSWVKVDNLPSTASEFRSWKNMFLTFLTRVAAIDQTGGDVILNWLLTALLMDSRHLKGKLGMRFQTYAESCQLARHAPRGRAFLYMLAQHSRLDLNRGSTLTQQALLDLPLEGYTPKDLEKFVERIEYVLNGIPQSHQPNEITKFTWLYSRVNRCKLLQRHIDKIHDSREISHVRTWDVLMRKIKDLLIEVREDANEESVREALLPPSKPKTIPKAKGNPKGSKGKGKGKGDGGPKVSPPQPPAKSKAHPSPPPAKAKPGSKPTVPSLFYPKGICNRGDSCPFSHEDSAASATSKAHGSKTATAKATVATIIASGATRAAKSNLSFVGTTLRLAFLPFKFAFTALTALTSLLTPVDPNFGIGSFEFKENGGSLAAMATPPPT